MKRHKKKIINIIAISCILAVCIVQTPVFAANSSIEVAVFQDGTSKKVTFNNSLGYPFIDANNRTLCPLKTIADTMELSVIWNAENRTASFTGGGNVSIQTEEGEKSLNIQQTIRFTIGKKTYTVEADTFNSEGKAIDHVNAVVSMDTAPIIKNGRTYAPVRYLAEAFACQVRWDKKHNAVIIGQPSPANAPQDIYDLVNQKFNGAFSDIHDQHIYTLLDAYKRIQRYEKDMVNSDTAEIPRLAFRTDEPFLDSESYTYAWGWVFDIDSVGDDLKCIPSVYKLYVDSEGSVWKYENDRWNGVYGAG
ncbi:MAG: copper amine oxidase N-terminal domain-containing protein [Anaerovoracaceae bacterium]